MATAEDTRKQFVRDRRRDEDDDSGTLQVLEALTIKERELAAALFLEGTDPYTLPLKREIAERIQRALSTLTADSEVVAIARCLDILQGPPGKEEESL